MTTRSEQSVGKNCTKELLIQSSTLSEVDIIVSSSTKKVLWQHKSHGTWQQEQGTETPKYVFGLHDLVANGSDCWYSGGVTGDGPTQRLQRAMTRVDPDIAKPDHAKQFQRTQHEFGTDGAGKC